jgi:protein TonB
MIMGNFVLTNLDFKPGNNSIPEFSRGVLMETEVSVWSSLFSNLRDALFPKRQPPLELTSRPVAVADPLATRRNPATSAISLLMHAGAISMIIWLTLQAHSHVVVSQRAIVTPINIKPFIPVTISTAKAMGGGGGGGAHQIVEPSKGHIPSVAKIQTAPPQILRIDHPKLAVEPTVVMPHAVKLPDGNLPNVGLPQSPQIALASQGSGSGSGFGSGSGGGIGSGIGSGVGPGSGGGYGGGIMSVGGGVAAPQVIHSVDPEFTNEARQAKYGGVVSIQLIVDTNGNPQAVQVIRHLGMGLDEKAIEAVRQYRFHPAMYQGHPVSVRVVIDVNFHLY